MEAITTTEQINETTGPALINAIRPAVDRLIAAKKAAIVLRLTVDAIYREELGTMTIIDTLTGERIAENSKMHGASDDDFTALEAAVAPRVAAELNFQASEAGDCPALIAEHNVLKAKWALMETAAPIFGTTVSDWQRASVADRDQFVALLTKSVLAFAA